MSEHIKIRVHAHTSPEAMIDAAKKAGLSDKAANYFRYYNEISLELTVDPEDGAVYETKILSAGGN